MSGLSNEQWDEMQRLGQFASNESSAGESPGRRVVSEVTGLGEGFTDVANANRFVRLHGPHVRFVESWKQWIVWDEDAGRWVRDLSGARMTGLAKDVPHEMFRSSLASDDSRLRNAAKTAASQRGLKAMVELAQGDQLIQHDDLDADHWALGVRNGWVDLHDGSHHPADPSKLITMTCPVGFDPEAECVRWLEALEQWMPDAEVRDYFQRLVGEALVGTVTDHHLVVIYGPGGNGKGTAIGTLAKLLGPYFAVPHKSLLIQQKSESHPTDVATLFRVRLAVASESDTDARLSEAQIKNLTGGDKISARRMYQDFWEFEPTHSLWLQTNHLPKVNGTDEGIWRRVRVLEWPTQFLGAAADHDLTAKLEAELPGILNWAIEGCLRWQTVGLTPPAAVRTATDNYRRAEDLLQQWIVDEGWTLTPNGSTNAGALLDSWSAWTETNHGHRRGGQEMAKRLQDADCEKIPGRPVKWLGITRTDSSQSQR